MAPKLLLIPIFSLIILVIISTSPTANAETDSSLHLINETWNWELETQSNLEPEIIEDEDALHRRSLYWHSPAPRKYYISYGALSANRVPCPPRSGRSYYTHNCFKARGPVHPYTRGCSAITRCRSYIPGSWADMAGAMDLKEYDVPNATSLLLIGPKGSGKSSLVNKISRVLEDNVLLSGRAQVSHNSFAGDGTYFLHEYMIPRVSGSFCLYDTRGLSADSSENQTVLNRWMKKGVRHGELMRRKSDSMSLKAQLKCKARRSSSASQRRAVDFVIFVVNGLSMLESMDSADEKKKWYSQMIATNFNNPLLSFKDDKPVVVVTHGDLLPLSDRVRVRVYLGDILGIPPTRQIFDIPENNDSSTALAIFDMLTYSLERADRNLPTKRDLFVDKVYAVLNLLFWIVMAVVIIVGFPCLHIRQPQGTTTPSPESPPVHIHQPQATTTPPPPIEVDWAKMRHLWLEE